MMDYEMIDAKSDSTNAYDWTLPYWQPIPVPDGFDPYEVPWIRPEQVPMSFVGKLAPPHHALHHLQFDLR